MTKQHYDDNYKNNYSIVVFDDEYHSIIQYKGLRQMYIHIYVHKDTVLLKRKITTTMLQQLYYNNYVKIAML